MRDYHKKINNPELMNIDLLEQQLVAANTEIKKLKDALEKIISIRNNAPGAGQSSSLDAIERIAKNALK